MKNSNDTLPEYPRNKLWKGVLRAIAEIEYCGLSVRVEGRGCNVYFVVRRGEKVVLPQSSGGKLLAFAAGLRAGLRAFD